MLTLPARPLILTCGAALALFDLVALLPGNPDVTSTRSFLVVVAVQTLIVWRLLHRSLIAWSLVVLLSASTRSVSYLWERRMRQRSPLVAYWR